MGTRFHRKYYGHKAFWECGQFNDVIKNQYYAISDPDVLPVEECPDDFMELFFNILQENPKFTKVGFSLKIDDIPDYNIQKDFIIKWERQFYEAGWDYMYKDNKIKIFNAALDTTFALYLPCKNFSKVEFYKAIRTNFPYQLRHLPWYRNQNETTEEQDYYMNSTKNDISHYSINLTSEELFKMHFTNNN